MAEKSELHLGQRVWFGAEKVGATVDGLSWDWVGLRLDEGGYVIANWSDVHRKEEN